MSTGPISGKNPIEEAYYHDEEDRGDGKTDDRRGVNQLTETVVQNEAGYVNEIGQ